MAYNLQTLFSVSSKYRGGKFVWWKDAGNDVRSNVLSGNTILNPYLGMGYAFAADLFEYRLKEGGYLLKTFLVTNVAAANATTVYVDGKGYSHIPEVGNKIMAAPDAASTVGFGATVTAVTLANDKFELTLDRPIGALAVGAILVEAKLMVASEADVQVKSVVATAPATATTGDKYINTTDKKLYTATAADTWGTGALIEAGKYYVNTTDGKFYALISAAVTEVVPATVLVKNPNTFIEADIEFLPTDGRYGFTDVSHSVNVVYGKKAFIERMQPLPKYVLAKNRSYIEGVFEI